MTEQPTALWLADALETAEISYTSMVRAASELRRLHAENAMLHQRHHDDNVEYTRVLAQRDALLEALKGITPPMPPIDAPCHYGLVQQEKCAHCRRIAKARAAIKAVEDKQ